MVLRMNDFDAVTFDVYGTLIDWEPSIVAFLARWAKENSVRADAGQLLMMFDRARAEIQKVRPAYLYPDVLRLCFDRIASEVTVRAKEDDREAFAAQPHTWPAFGDSHKGLKELQKNAKVCALSNIDEASLRSSCARLDFEFDLVVTAERVGAYKPDWPHFNTAISELGDLGIPKNRILHVGQSLRADITPANKLGLSNVWIDRPDKLLGLYGEGAAEAKPGLTVTSLAELVSVLTAKEPVAP